MAHDVGVGINFGDLLDGHDWYPMPVNMQNYKKYLWFDGTYLKHAPVDFAATFDGAMWMSNKSIDVPAFNRNPLRVRPHFVVPRHHHNFDEMIFVLAGEYSIEHGDDGEITRVSAGEFFTSKAGTAYTMTAGAEGVTYIETWPGSVLELETYWHDVGWVHREAPSLSLEQQI